MGFSAVQIQFVSDSSILISFAEAPSVKTSQKVLSLFNEILELQKDGSVTNLHPAYQSLLLDFAPEKVDPNWLIQKVRTLVQNSTPTASHHGRVVAIPVHYGGPEGEDLESVAEMTSMPADEVIRFHSGAEYTVAFLGFAPGFPYLLGLPDSLSCPRKKTPRVRVPAGSIALAGNQTGVYPMDSPGGWQLIGRTSEIMFDPHRQPATLLVPGDRVRFIKSSQDFADKKTLPLSQGKIDQPVLKVEDGGAYSTIQDLGRDGWTHLGVSPGGAADPVALRIGNQILGNRPEAAAIEMTAYGGTFTFLKDTWFTVVGAECLPELDQFKISMWRSLPVCAGQRISIGRISKNLRSYLCVYGGIGVDAVMESRSTLVSSQWGGFEGRALSKLDVLPTGDQIVDSPTYRKSRSTLSRIYNDEVKILHVTKGPQWSWFTEASRSHFFEKEFHVTNEVNRLGIRLEGPKIEFTDEFARTELISEGIANGAIQVPAGGQPMILYCEQRTTGGYPKIANVIKADLFRLGQVKPGGHLRFVLVDLEEAWRLNREWENQLNSMVHEF